MKKAVIPGIDVDLLNSVSRYLFEYFCNSVVLANVTLMLLSLAAW